MTVRRWSHFLKLLVTPIFTFMILGGGSLAPVAAFAETSFSPSAASSGELHKALAAPTGAVLFSAPKDSGFSLSSSTYADRLARTNNELLGPSSSRTADIVGDPRSYALLVDGKYDFKYENSDATSLRPYIAGGVGMAVTGTRTGLLSGDGAMTPLVRVGGGVAYRLDEKWNLSLDYRTGLAGGSTKDRLFTGRGEQPVDLQTLNMGVKLKF